MGKFFMLLYSRLIQTLYIWEYWSRLIMIMFGQQVTLKQLAADGPDNNPWTVQSSLTSITEYEELLSGVWTLK